MRNPVNECTRTPNCTKPVNVTCDRFQTSRLNASEGTSFVVDVGPSGGARGYSAITGTLQDEMSSTHFLLWRSHTLIGVILLLHPLCYITNRMLSRL